jgi:hypothetical protein
MSGVTNESPGILNGGFEVWEGGVYMGMGPTMPPHLYLHELIYDIICVTICELYEVMVKHI